MSDKCCENCIYLETDMYWDANHNVHYMHLCHKANVVVTEPDKSICDAHSNEHYNFRRIDVYR